MIKIPLSRVRSLVTLGGLGASIFDLQLKDSNAYAGVNILSPRAIQHFPGDCYNAEA